MPQWLMELLRRPESPVSLRTRTLRPVMDALGDGWFTAQRAVNFTGLVLGAVGANSTTTLVSPDATVWPLGWWFLLVGGAWSHAAGAGAVDVSLDVNDCSKVVTGPLWSSITTTLPIGPSEVGMANTASGALPLLVPPRCDAGANTFILRNISALGAGDRVDVRLSGFAIPPGVNAQ